jgi:hypothetical protein
MLFIDFRGHAIRAERDVERVGAEMERHLSPLGHRVHAIINYRGCSIDPAARDSYCRMIEALEASYLLGVTCYGGAPARPPLEADSGAGVSLNLQVPLDEERRGVARLLAAS